MDKIVDLGIKLFDYFVKNRDHQSVVTYLGVITLSFFVYKMSVKIDKISDEVQHISLRVTSPELHNRKMAFEQRGREAWEAGKERVIEFIRDNHDKYKANPIKYKAKLLLVGGEVLDEQIKITRRGFGVKTQNDFKILSVKTFYPFVQNLNRWIDYACDQPTLPKGWEYQVSMIFDNSTTTWIIEMNKLEMSRHHKESGSWQSVIVGILNKKPYVITDLENNTRIA